MSFTTALGHTPVFAIHKDGVDITSNFQDRVTAIQVESVDGQGQGDKLTLTLDDRDFAIELPIVDGPSAAKLDVYLGYAETGLYHQGLFEINEANPVGMPKSMRLVGTTNGFTSGLKAPMIAALNGQTVQQIVDGVAAAGGFGSVVDPAIGNKVVEYLNQHSSPLHLLQALERTYNGLAKFGDGKLSFTQRGTGENASGVLSGDFALTADDFGDYDIQIQARTSYSKVRASWWDKTKHQLQWVQNANQAAGSSTTPYLIKRAFNTQDEAQSAADAMMDSLNRGQRRGTIKLAKGDPSIHGGAPFTVSAMREGVNGSWLVNRATHTYTKDAGIGTALDVYSADGAAYGQIQGEDGPDATGIGVDLPAETRITTPAGSAAIGSA